ncbi:cysteine hydrolase family protein [Nocardia brasiliensis]|uniref:Isochorismatase hydrolase n=1 Tax=Nocardia brasiliensis (strain ATCC 700358 / HUJEG-1) TaxID=1133849 RepID=K0EL43_NOCB7|nr:cysteine hydrolase [Nocardia brasiliensis]AFU00193.1 isochorismatase hydrolase [Nocardia brasiliensis ATCC 700358]OCF86374.1 isochorismatase [Nocardia brasiliensis]
MREAFGLSIPQTVEDACDPRRMALLIYDMQVGIVSQLPDGDQIVRACVQLREAARANGFRVFYTRHMSLPIAASGVAQLRTAMQWQRVDDPAGLRAGFPQGSPQYQLVPELTPDDNEVVFDKVTMSAFAATPLDIALRDCGIDTFAIAGIALEVGIEPTIRHSLDLAYLPILVADACGAGHPAAAQRTHAALQFAGGTLVSDTAALTDFMSAPSR